MKERPILFSAPMVRAILNRTKTQTRRIVNPQPDGNLDNSPREVSEFYDVGNGWFIARDLKHDPVMSFRKGKDSITGDIRCPYGNENLWVKETHAYEQGEVMMSSDDRRPVGSKLGMIAYRADTDAEKPPVGKHWKPSIFMRRIHSRITLEIVSVRVERLQEISPEDAIAEGIRVEKGSGMIESEDCYMMTTNSGYMRGPKGAIEAYRNLWESINGAGSWALNPWVWVVEFRKL